MRAGNDADDDDDDDEDDYNDDDDDDYYYDGNADGDVNDGFDGDGGVWCSNCGDGDDGG